MEFRQLEVFAAVAETKSFSKAADELFLSQSTISSHIKNLEKELQKTLIVRSTKKVLLTETGTAFLFYAKRILDTRDAALNAINNPSDSFLHLGASTIPSGYLLPELLSDFRRTHSHVFFNIQQGDSSDIQSKVLDGSIELGIIGQAANSAKCISIPFCSDELVIITPSSDYFLSLQKKSNAIEKLLSEPIIMREQGSGTKKAADVFLESMEISSQDLNIVAQNNDLEAIKQMVTNGMGISIFSRLAVKNLEKQGQVLVFPLNSNIQRKFYLIYLKENHLKPVLQEFVDFVLSSYCL